MKVSRAWVARLSVVVSVLAACSSSPGAPAPPADGGTADARAEAGAEAGAAATLAGTVRDKGGVIVSGAKVEVGAAAVFSDTEGKYSLALPAGGALAVKVTRNWFQPLDENVTVAASGITTRDLTLEEVPLKLDPADAALVASYNRTFDWTKQPISLAIVARPTRRDFDNTVYYRNPALYRDTSAEAPLVPATAPEIAGGTARNFNFPLGSGRNMGQQALDVASIADSLATTALGPAEPTEFMMWAPMLTWVGEWDPAKAADLRAAGVAVRQQNWGGNNPRPQDIERAYLDASGALWVEVVFAPFVQVGPGITDNNGDGRKEVYAKIAAIHYSADVVDKLGKEYGKTTFTTHGLSKEVTKSLNELYSTATAAQVERYIGQPIEVPGVGTINYPFVVLKHAGGQKNVILVAP